MPDIEKMNLSYLFNYHYYAKEENLHYEKFNKALTNRRFTISDEVIPFTDDCFCLKTSYPGLLIGIGATHEYGENTNGNDEEGAEVKLGFTLDYVTGQPVIPGSTVKGVLRSAMKYHADYVAQELLETNVETVNTIERAVFAEGSNKVVFFDAIPITTGEEGCLLGLDNINPHSSIIKNPTPLTMLKVLSEVSFLFRFGFSHWNNECDIDKARLMNTFMKLIINLGIGAKTNVGYGVMKEAVQPTEFKYLCYLDRPVIQTAIGREYQRNNAPTCKKPGCNEPVTMNRNGEYNKYCTKCYNEYRNRGY